MANEYKAVRAANLEELAIALTEASRTVEGDSWYPCMDCPIKENDQWVFLMERRVTNPQVRRNIAWDVPVEDVFDVEN